MRIRSIDAVAIDIPLTRNFGGMSMATASMLRIRIRDPMG